jgi:hypothetical protein
MEVTINNTSQMMQYERSIRYLTIFPDKTIKYYSSLRSIAEDICVDHTTISKKLGENNPCICQSQSNNYIFLVRKL